MKKTVLHLGLQVLGLTRAPSVVRRLVPNQGACAVMYHGLSDTPSAGMTNFTRLHLDADVFRQQARLFARCYRVLPLGDVAEAIRKGERLPPNCVVLTFDDGYESNYRLAFPILREFGLRATVFVTTGFVEKEFYQWPDRLEFALGATQENRLLLDFENLPPELPVKSLRKRQAAHLVLDEAMKRVPQERQLEAIAHVEDRLGAALSELDPDDVPLVYRPLSWEQIREMAASEHVTIGAHTHTHPILSRVSAAYARRDMSRCLDLLREKAGLVATTFAYPNGKSADYDARTRAMLADLGIRAAVTTELGFARPGSDAMTINRVPTPRSRSDADVLCSGLAPVLKKILPLPS